MISYKKIYISFCKSVDKNIIEISIFPIFLILRFILIRMDPADQYYYGINFILIFYIIYLIFILSKSFFEEFNSN